MMVLQIVLYCNEFLIALPINWKLYLVILFNKIMKDRIVPDDWSKIVASILYKKSDAKHPETYRPIALVNALTKLFTQILYKRIIKWCNKNNAIPEYQSSF